MKKNIRFGSVLDDRTVQIKRRRLPHLELAHRIYFITFRLADSIPKKVVDAWCLKQQVQVKRAVTQQEKRNLWHQYQRKLNRYLDDGRGSCLLAKKEAAEILRNSFDYFDGIRYLMDTYVIMPNHVHMLVMPLKDWPLSKILHSWKSFSAHEINKLLGRSGPIWMRESFDHIVRSRQDLQRFRNYILANPEKAGLPKTSYLLGCGQGFRGK